MKKLAVLGSTGSIGKSLADVVVKNKDKFEIIAMSAYKNVEEIVKQINTFEPKLVAVADYETRNLVKQNIDKKDIEILIGQEGLEAVAEYNDSDMFVSAVVGSVGLVPLMKAIKAGKDVAFANKEAMVMAGDLIMREVCLNSVNFLPVDSEHSAIFQCLEGENTDNINKIILTASGGPFREKSYKDLKNITPDEAAAHPKWSMGRKISVDSATLMNKGLEVIEAKHLFSVNHDKIEVVVHPQSIIHSMVEFKDKSILAQMSVPDMRLAIQYALTYPDRSNLDIESLDFIKMGEFTFCKPDFEKFPCLKLAFDACAQGGSMPAALNASNEVAVDAFLNKEIGFLQISEIVNEILEKEECVYTYNLDEIIEKDKEVRRKTKEIIAGI
jgi:1-deoxy-D-xylulose-5-phosphate reductoisomerase